MIPSINSKGTFTYLAPYDTVLDANQEFTVTSVRSLTELVASGDDPLNNIYIPAGDTEANFKADLAAGSPIVTLVGAAGDFHYVPASKLASSPKLTGIPYVERTLIVTLGHLPTDLALNNVTADVTASIQSVLGVTPIVTVADTSAVVRVSDAKHATLTATRKTKMTSSYSYKTRYTLLNKLYQDQQVLLNNVNAVYIGKGIGG